MKRVLIFALPFLLMGLCASKANAQQASSKAAPKKMAKAAEAEAKEIKWLSIDEIQAKMKTEPKKVYIDVYTDWCGWCKRMDATTFTNPDVIKYMNKHFYALKLNAERKDTIHFLGKDYYYKPEYKANTFAAELLQGKMGFPTSVFFLENFASASPVPGYHDVKDMEKFLTFFGNDAYKTQKWEDYDKAFKPTWNPGPAADMTPIAH